MNLLTQYSTTYARNSSVVGSVVSSDVTLASEVSVVYSTYSYSPLDIVRTKVRSNVVSRMVQKRKAQQARNLLASL